MRLRTSTTMSWAGRASPTTHLSGEATGACIVSYLRSLSRRAWVVQLGNGAWLLVPALVGSDGARLLAGRNRPARASAAAISASEARSSARRSPWECSARCVAKSATPVVLPAARSAVVAMGGRLSAAQRATHGDHVAKSLAVLPPAAREPAPPGTAPGRRPHPRQEPGRCRCPRRPAARRLPGPRRRRGPRPRRRRLGASTQRSRPSQCRPHVEVLRSAQLSPSDSLKAHSTADPPLGRSLCTMAPQDAPQARPSPSDPGTPSAPFRRVAYRPGAALPLG